MKNGYNAIGRLALGLLAALAVAASSAAAQTRQFLVDREQSAVKFTLGDVLHTVHGSFKLKEGELRIEPAGKMSGEIVIDARSGESGSGMRDRKMHKEVLESARFPEIAFRPDRIEGMVAGEGQSSVMVHGMFSIHGTEREITVPAQVEISAERWSAKAHFTVPYAKWGMKNPSTLFLKVSDSVQIDLAAAGTIVKTSATSIQ